MTYRTAVLTVAYLVTAGSAVPTANAAETLRGDSNPEGDVTSSTLDGLDLEVYVQPSESDLGTLQDDSSESQIPADDLRVNFNTWAWMLGAEGKVGARGVTTDVSADFGDILDASDSIFALSGRLEIGKDPWGVFIDGMFAKLGIDDVPGPPSFGSTDITYEMTLIDFGATYRIGEWTPSGDAQNNSRDITLDLYAGGRFTKLDLEVDPTLAATQSRDKDWLDPIVGAKLVLPIAKKWHIAANGDIGGFGVESDFTWSATSVLGADFSLFDHPATVFFGYRAIGWDFTEGSGSNRFTWDVVMHGPILGFSLLF